MVILPQLILLQKTLVSIEGLGRQLYPDLDLWHVARPLLERWMSEQIGWRGLLRTLRQEAPHYATLLPQLPRLLHQSLENKIARPNEDLLQKLLQQQQRNNNLLGLVSVLLLGVLAWELFIFLTGRY